MAAFEYRQAQEIQRAFAAHGVRYLFLGKSGAILLGYPDTTQDADLYVDKQRDNCHAVVPALHELGFELSVAEDEEIHTSIRYCRIFGCLIQPNVYYSKHDLPRLPVLNAAGPPDKNASYSVFRERRSPLAAVLS